MIAAEAPARHSRPQALLGHLDQLLRLHWQALYLSLSLSIYIYIYIIHNAHSLWLLLVSYCSCFNCAFFVYPLLGHLDQLLRLHRQALSSFRLLLNIYIYIHTYTKAFFVHLLYTLFFAPGTSRQTTAFTLAGGDLVSPYFQTSSYLFLTSILLDKA